MRSGHLDLAVAPAGGGTPEVEEKALYAWTLRVVLPGRLGDDQRVAPSPRITAEELAAFEIGAAPRGHRSRDLLAGACAAAGVDLTVAVESTSVELLLHLARCGSRYAVVIPDDAFGTVRPKLGPALLGPGGAELGGAYSIYMRKPEANPSDEVRDEHIARVRDAVVRGLRR